MGLPKKPVDGSSPPREKGIISKLLWALDQPKRLSRSIMSSAQGLPFNSGETDETFQAATNKAAEGDNPVSTAIQMFGAATKVNPIGMTQVASDAAINALRGKAPLEDLPRYAADSLDPLNALPEKALSKAVTSGLGLVSEAKSLGPVASAATHLLERPQLNQFAREANVIGHTTHEGMMANLKEAKVAERFRALSDAEKEDLIRYALDPASNKLRVKDYREVGKLVGEGGIPAENVARYKEQLQQGGDWLRYEDLTAAQKKAFDAFKAYSEKTGKSLLEKGLIDKLEVNPLSKTYVHRPYEKDHDVIKTLLEGMEKRNAPQWKAPTVGAQKSRTADIALGAQEPIAQKADASLGNIVGSHANQMAKAAEYKALVEKIKEFRGGQLTEADAKFIASRLQPKGIFGVTVDSENPLVKAAQALNTSWSKNILQRNPHHHFGNLVDDMGQLAHNDLNPLSALAGHQLLKKAKAGDSEALALIERAKGAGVKVEGAATRLDAPARGAESVGQLNREAGYASSTGQKAKDILSGEALDRILPEWVPASKKFGQAYEGRVRLGAFASAEKKTGSAAEAGKKVANTLLDYNSNDRLLTTAKTFFPAVTWKLKAPAMVVRGIADNPLRAKQVGDIYQSFQQDGPNRAPTSWEDGTVIKAPEAVKDAYSSARAAVGGTKFSEHDDLLIKGPHPLAGIGLVGDVGAAVKDITTADEPKTGQKLLASAQPWVQAPATLLFGKDRFGRPYDSAGARVAGAASQLLSPLVPAPLQTPINKTSQAMGGPNFLGGYYTPKKRADRTPVDDVVDRMASSLGPSIYQATPTESKKIDYREKRDSGKLPKKRHR